MGKLTAATFKELRVLEGLLARPEDATWLERPPARPDPKPTVLYLGCNILRTPHLAQTAVALLRTMGEDFVAVAGPAFCCGIPYEREDGLDEARRHGENLASQFARFRPRQVVVWCPTCFHFLKHVLAVSGPFRLVHVSEFLAENRLRFPFKPQSVTRVALHYHCDSPDAVRQADAARMLLSAIPGIELVEIGSAEAWGRNCTGMARDRLGRQAWEALIIPFFEKAAAADANIFALLHHGCHRMYAGYQQRVPFVVEHYLTTVARNLDIAYPDRYKAYLGWKDRARILNDCQPCLKANRVSPEDAAATIDKVFVADQGL